MQRERLANLEGDIPYLCGELAQVGIGTRSDISKSEASLSHLTQENELLKEEIRSLKSRLMTQSSLASEGFDRSDSLSESAMQEVRRALTERRERLLKVKVRVDFELRDIELQLEIMQFSVTSSEQTGETPTSRSSRQAKPRNTLRKRSTKRTKKGKTFPPHSSAKSHLPR